MWVDAITKPLQGQKFRDMQAFLQNCAKDYDDNVKIKKLMKPQSIASLRECVGKHTKSPLKHLQASPTCVSQITTGGKPKVTWERNKLKMFPVNSNFPVRHTWELTHGKINEFGATYQPHDSPVPSKGQTKAERKFGAGVRSIAIT
jgi:hypothetical protein